jgi:hypothetical protein
MSLVVSDPGSGGPPGWLGRARRTVLSEAALCAFRSGKPLLLIDPGKGPERRDRGRMWGELLHHGTDRQVAPLGLAELACGGEADLVALAGPSARPSGRGGELGISSRQHVGPVARLIAVVLGEDGPGASVHEALTVPLDGELVDGPINAIIDLRIETMAALVVQALGGAGRVASLVEQRGGEAALARDARQVLRDGNIPGSTWAEGGRGVTLWGEPPRFVERASLRVPARSRRFLLFAGDTLRTTG